MDFVSAISTGAPIKYVVEEYAYAFLKAVNEGPKIWRAKIAHQFVRQCFQALGLYFNVSVADFHRTQDHPYRNENANYIFQPVNSVLEGLDEFLEDLPSLFGQYGRELATALEQPETASTKRFDKLTRPLPCYLEVIVIWTKLVHSICDSIDLGEVNVDRFLCEPMARISFSILRGLVKELPRHGDDMPGLKDICLTLSIYVRYGMFFEATSKVILMPMLDIFRDHFTTFLGEEKSALSFIHCIFSVQMEKEDNCYVMIYQFLEDRIQEFARTEQRDRNGNLYLRIITNELITDNYLIVQFETLQKDTSKPLLMATLHYIMTLQYHVASLESFPKRLLEEMLHLIIRMPLSLSAVRILAAEVYTKMAQRMFYEQDIGVHILDTFAKFMSGRNKNQNYNRIICQLTRYLMTLIQHFPYLQRFDFYIKVLRLACQTVHLDLSLLVAHSICVLHDLHKSRYSESEEALFQIDDLLSNWPYILERQHPPTRTILYSLYKAIDFESVAAYNEELLCTLENFVLGKFLNDDSLTDAELYGLYETLLRSTRATKNAQLHKNAEREFLVEYEMVQVHLNEQRETYYHYIPRLYALLKNKRLSAGLINNFIDILASELMDKPIESKNMAYYGPECLAYMLMLVLDEENIDETMSESTYNLGLKLIDFCITQLSGSINDAKKIKSMFRAVFLLLIRLPIQLTSANYEVLKEQLCNSAVIEQAGNDTLIHTYYQEMHSIFRNWHGYRSNSLPNKRIWKVLMPYKMASSTPDLVSPEIEKLIHVLICQSTATYTHSLAVILLHICDDLIAKKNFVSVINGHLNQIKSQATIFDSWLIRFTTFQTLLKLLYKNLSVQRPYTLNSRRHNRLILLQYIMHLVKPLRLEDFHFKELSRWIYNITLQANRSSEKDEMDLFTDQFSAYKYMCEDEIEALANRPNFKGKLMPMPPGPLTLWQTHMLHVEDDT